MQRDRKDERGEKLLQGETQRKDGRYEYKYRDRDGTRKSVYADTLKQLRIREWVIRTSNLLWTSTRV
ncbi:MAG: integrase DNA-binding domain-containing protein [Lachnospiraceae bacterium]|nr:integrase DNA-binding domain-containing protein [Lachnospiraceae bacterium]